MNIVSLMALSRIKRHRSHRTHSGNTANLSPEIAVPIALFVVAFICFVLAFNLKNKLLKVLFIIGSAGFALGGIISVISNIVN